MFQFKLKHHYHLCSVGFNFCPYFCLCKSKGQQQGFKLKHHYNRCFSFSCFHCHCCLCFYSYLNKNKNNSKGGNDCKSKSKINFKVKVKATVTIGDISKGLNGWRALMDLGLSLQMVL